MVSRCIILSCPAPCFCPRCRSAVNNLHGGLSTAFSLAKSYGRSIVRSQRARGVDRRGDGARGGQRKRAVGAADAAEPREPEQGPLARDGVRAVLRQVQGRRQPRRGQPQLRLHEREEPGGHRRGGTAPRRARRDPECATAVPAVRLLVREAAGSSSIISSPVSSTPREPSAAPPNENARRRTTRRRSSGFVEGLGPHALGWHGAAAKRRQVWHDQRLRD